MFSGSGTGLRVGVLAYRRIGVARAATAPVLGIALGILDAECLRVANRSFVP
jgi:hypothetical protein